MPAAMLRPSAMAQTMSEAPRLISPPAKTPSRLVMKCSSAATAPRCIVFHAEAVEQTILHRTGEAHGEENEIRIHLEVAVGNRRELAVLELHLIGRGASSPGHCGR